MSDFVEEIESGDLRRSLVAIRDTIAHELDGHRCASCTTSRLKAGDQAALYLRLIKVIEEISALPSEEEPTVGADGEKVVSLGEIRNRRASTRAPAAENPTPSGKLGTRSGPRRQGGRKRAGARGN